MMLDFEHPVLKLPISGEQFLLLTKLMQMFGHKGIQIYIKKLKIGSEFEEEPIERSYSNPKTSIKLEAARNIFLIEEGKFNFSQDKENIPNGAIAMDHMGYKIIVSTAGFIENSTNVFFSLLLMSFITELRLETTLNIRGLSTIYLKKFLKKEIEIYENILKK